ncbi:MAG: hypothetical protein V3574_03955 [Candidatus Moraniibacteriota bacterium]
MMRVVEDLKKSSNKEECLKRVYDLLSDKYQGVRVKTYLKFPTVFKKDVNFFWNQGGFLHCTNMNYLARVFLVGSGFFREEDVILRWTLIWYISPHQYLRIKIAKDKFINVDIWAKDFGIKFGDYARGFN